MPSTTLSPPHADETHCCHDCLFVQLLLYSWHLWVWMAPHSPQQNHHWCAVMDLQQQQVGPSQCTLSCRCCCLEVSCMRHCAMAGQHHHSSAQMICEKGSVLSMSHSAATNVTTSHHRDLPSLRHFWLACGEHSSSASAKKRRLRPGQKLLRHWLWRWCSWCWSGEMHEWMCLLWEGNVGRWALKIYDRSASQQHSDAHCELLDLQSSLALKGIVMAMTIFRSHFVPSLLNLWTEHLMSCELHSLLSFQQQ